MGWGLDDFTFLAWVMGGARLPFTELSCKQSGSQCDRPSGHRHISGGEACSSCLKSPGAGLGPWLQLY